MSAPIGPGDWVERIAPSPECGFVQGALYQVARVTEVRGCGACDGCPGLHIVGWPTEYGFYASCCFRLIYKPRRELIDSLKAPPKRARKPSRQDVHA